MNVIGIDPSLTCTGIIALDLRAGCVMDCRAVTTAPDGSGPKSTDLVRRLHELAQEIRSMCARYPSLIAIEGQVGASMGKSSLASTYKLGAAYGTIVGACPTRPVAILPAEVKRRLTGTKAASKAECWTQALARLGLQEADVGLAKTSQAKREAILDALAVAVAAQPEVAQCAALGGL